MTDNTNSTLDERHANFRRFVVASKPDVLAGCLERFAARTRDLEATVETYSQLACAALDVAAALTQRNKQLARRIDTLNGRIRDLLGVGADDAERAA